MHSPVFSVPLNMRLKNLQSDIFWLATNHKTENDQMKARMFMMVFEEALFCLLDWIPLLIGLSLLEFQKK